MSKHTLIPVSLVARLDRYVRSQSRGAIMPLANVMPVFLQHEWFCRNREIRESTLVVLPVAS